MCASPGGFEFDSLTAGIPMTLRVSAPGYVDLDTTVTPTLGIQQAVLLEVAPGLLRMPIRFMEPRLIPGVGCSVSMWSSP